MNRSTSWLKRIVVGMLALVAGLGLTASAQTNALLLDNATFYNIGRQALTSMNFNVTTITSANSLTNQLATGTWDIVVIEQYNSAILTNSALALRDYVANGGAVIMNYWDMDGDSGGSSLTSAPILRATFGVQATISFTNELPVYVWQPTNSIFTTPYAISGLATNGDTSWTDNGDQMEAGPSSFAQALAGFTTTTNQFEQTAIIEANNGRTICNGFLFDNMDLTNGPKLLQNEITHAIKPTLPTMDASLGEFTDRIRVSWNSTAATQYELFRSTNATSGFVSLGVLAGTASNYDDTAVTLPGTYYYYSINASNAFGTRGISVAQAGWRRSAENHAVGDYDGDLWADPAVYNETTGQWAVRASGSSYGLFKTATNWLGGPGFVAAVADYDNDLRADPAVYSESTGVWKIMLSGSGYWLFTSTTNAFGESSFYSALGTDFDGDRRADLFVYNETEGVWHFLLSADSYLQYESHFRNLGGMGWSMAFADYDGDRFADPILYQETTGTWKILLSGSGYALMTTTFGDLGGLGFIPVPADYFRQGKDDPAVYNPVTGEWRILLTTNTNVRLSVNVTF